MLVLPMMDDLAGGVVHSIRSGSIDELSQLLAGNPGLATCVLRSENGSLRTLLHVVADWPAYFPMGPTAVRILVDAGADPDQVGTTGEPSETALHWAASSDDVEVAEALIDCGADINAPGASIAGGPPLDNAVGYGCWSVARLLVDRGARVDRLSHAGALGLRARFDDFDGDTIGDEERGVGVTKVVEADARGVASFDDAIEQLRQLSLAPDRFLADHRLWPIVRRGRRGDRREAGATGRHRVRG